ncbi:MAG: hypothetical protein LQ352_002252 [Teloschistes flavicans]|nr:MAG: hypothetical protein LQ352_002252 [Teloschistes flavicans]
MSTSEIATSYAALILADEDLDVTALEGKNVKDMLLNVGSGGGAAAAPTSGAGGGATAEAPIEQAKEEKKEEEKEESDEDMGFGLFD